MYKKSNVVMLPTNEKADITMSLMNILLTRGSHPENNNYKNQHLYITSNDEIKEGDVVFDSNNNYINRAGTVEHCNYFEHIKKVLATTDNTVKYPEKFPSFVTLPQIPQQFIQHFVKEYNKGNIITDVMVEYEEYFDKDIAAALNIEDYSSDEYHSLTLNIKLEVSKDNTITIKKVKDSWSREELKQKCLAWFNIEYDISNRGNNINYDPSEEFDKWIEENL